MLSGSATVLDSLKIQERCARFESSLPQEFSKFQSISALAWELTTIFSVLYIISLLDKGNLCSD
jgi:hypothetical protein